MAQSNPPRADVKALPTPAEIDTTAPQTARERPDGPTAGLPDPDAALDVYYAAMACLHQWLTWLLAEVERVNGPVSAQLLADDLKARLAAVERAGAASPPIPLGDQRG
jgi:hypothetical protein